MEEKNTVKKLDWRRKQTVRKLSKMEYGRFPVLESTHNESGDVVIVTGDNQGSFVRYTFTE